jgi:hypothetical protein
MSKRYCRHKFIRIVLEGIWASKWKCVFCGLKVRDSRDAELLEGGGR